MKLSWQADIRPDCSTRIEMRWFNIKSSCSRDRLDLLEEHLWNQGAVSVTVEDASDTPIYEPRVGEEPTWKQVFVTGLFEGDVKPAEITRVLERKGFDVVNVGGVKDRVWEREWLNRFEPMQFGDQLWVCPSGFEKPEGVVIQLDPGLAFGTGTHETTRLCLEYLDGLDVTGWRVLDYGCGSGVLGIGAVLKGAESASAVDNDPQALTATKSNAQRNKINLQVSFPEISLEPADLVFANILAGPLVELAPKLLSATKVGGLLVLSGVMLSQKQWLKGVYESKAKLIDEAELNGWIRLVWQR